MDLFYNTKRRSGCEKVSCMQSILQPEYAFKEELIEAGARPFGRAFDRRKRSYSLPALRSKIEKKDIPVVYPCVASFFGVYSAVYIQSFLEVSYGPLHRCLYAFLY